MTDAAGPIDEAQGRDGAAPDRTGTADATERAARRGAARELISSLAGNVFAYLSFVLSFLVIGAHWRAHHRVFRYLEAVDATFVQLTSAWLLVIVATPFLTEVIREGDLNVVRFGLYTLAQGLLLIVFAVLQRIAGRRGLFAPGTPPSVARESLCTGLAGALGFLVSIPLFPPLGAWAFVLWALVPKLLSLVSAAGRRARPRSAG